MKTILRQVILPATMGILSVMGALVAHAANDTWNGGGSPNFNWNVAGNWNTLPGSGDNLFFAGSTGLSNTNNFSSYSFNGVTFSSGAGSFVLTGNPFSLNGGITNSAANPQIISNAVTLAANGIVNVASGGSLTNAGVISGAFTLSKNGAGLLNLQGANTFSGVFSNWQGTVQVAAIGLAGTAGPLGAATNGIPTYVSSTLANNCPIALWGANSPTLQYIGPGETTDRQILVAAQDGKTVTLDASGTGPLIFMSGKTNVLGFIGNATAGDAVLTLTGSNTGTNTLAGDLVDNVYNSGDGLAIYKAGTGTWNLTGVKHQKGMVNVQNGILMFNTISNIGTACSLGTAATIYNSAVSGTQLSNHIVLGTSSTSGILLYTGSTTNWSNRNFGLNGNGTISAGTNGGSLVLSGSISNLASTASTLTLAGGGSNNILANVNDGVGGQTFLVVSNTGIWALTNANTFSGSTEPSAGELLLGNAAALQNSVLDLEGGDSGIVSFGTLTSVTLGGLESISGTRNLNVTNNAGAALPLTLTKNDGNTYNYPGTLQGGTTLTKTGNASQSLGALNFSGAATINAGTLTIQSGGSISSPQITVAGGATLDVSQLSGLTLNAGNVLAGAGTVNGNVTASSKSTISLTAPSSGAITLNITGNLTLNGGATNYLNLGSSTSASVNDVLTVNGSLTLSGLNTLVLNPYLGSLANGIYPLIEYQYGSLSGSLANLTVPAIPGYSLTLTNDTVDSPNVISVIVQAAHIPASLVWKGNGSNNNWDVQTTADWLNGASLVDFYNNDSVTLNDSSTNPTVNLVGSLVPAAIEVTNNVNNYTLTGSGLITGPTSLTKDGTGTLTLLTANSFSGGITIDTGTVQVGNGGATGWFGPGPITNNGALIVDVSSQNTLGVLAGTGSLTQAGSGVLTMTNDTSDFSGNVTVNIGTLAVTSESGLGTGTQVTLDGGGLIQTLETSPDSFYRSVVLNAGGGGFNHAIDLTLDASQLGNITGSGSLILEGAGQTIISGAETYSGGTMLKGGSLAIDNVSALGTNALTVTGGTLFRANGGEQLTMTIPVNLATNLTLGNVNDSGLTFTNGAWTLQGPAGTNLQLTVNTPVEIDSVIGQSSPGISLTKSGNNVLTLTGSNTFSGVFSNLQGTVQVTGIGLAGTPGPLGAAPNGGVTGNVGGFTNTCPIALWGPNSPTLQYTGPGETTDRSIFIWAQDGKTVTLDASGTGPLVFMSGKTNVFAYIQNATPGDDILNLAGSNPGLNTLAGDMVDTFYNSGDGMAIYKTGTGTWYLQGVKHQKGLVSVINGVLMFDSIANIGTPCSLGTAAAVYVPSSGVVPSYQISLGTNITSGTLQYNGTNFNSTTRSIALNGNGTISAGTNGGSLALNGNITNATTNAYALTLADGGNNTVGGIISDGVGGGQTSIIVNDTGCWSFTAANTYSGTTTVNTGTLNVSSAQAGTNTITVNDGATFGVTFSGTNQLSPATLTLGASAGATNAFIGLVSTTVAPINTPALVLNGNNAISLVGGAYYVAGYTYPLITCGSVSGGGSLTLGSAPSGLVATLVTNGTGPFTIALSVTSFSPDIWAAGNGNWDTSTPNWNIPIYANGDPVVFNDTASGAGPFTVTVTPASVSPGGIIVSNNLKNYAIGGNPIAGAGSLTKNGTGTATLAGANTYTGGTTINAGTLALSSSGTLGGGAMNLVLSGGTLDLGSLTGPTVGAVSITSAAGSGNTIQNGSLTAVSYACSAAATNVSVIVSANLLGASATLTKTNAGTLILTGANSYSGTTLGGGTLQIGNGGTTGTLGTGNVTVTGASGTTTVAFDRSDSVSSPCFVSNSIVGGSGTHALIVAYSGAVSLGGSNDNSNAGVDVKNGATLILAKASSVTPSVHAFGLGSTVENGGTLQLAGTGGAEIYSNLTLTVQSGGVFDLNSQSNLFNTLDLAGTGISAGGALINSASGTTSILAANVNLTANSSMGGVGNLSIPNVISGSGFGITKVGGGTATLSGANTYTGNTTVTAGTLEIVNPVIATNSTVTVASGAVLKLDFAVTNTVTALVLNGASQPAGVYNSTTGSPFITGTGSLLVAAASGPGTFTNPTGITGISVNGLNVVITATNGQAGDAYYLLESTNLALPKSQWTPVWTNVPGSAGIYTFTATNVVSPGAAQQFYILSNTNN